ncbi:MAG: nitrile hydratase [Kiloniellales bacterium]
MASPPEIPGETPGETPRKPHDLGGLPAGPIDRSEHVLNFWEWRVDALVRLLFAKGLLVDFAELRRAIEDLAPDAYDRLTYYERWAGAVATLLVEKGVLSQAELDQRIAAIKARGQGASS